MKHIFILTILLATFLVACKNKEKTAENTTDSKVVDNPSDTLVYMERTPCFGSCPVYAVTVYKNGNTIYQGKKFVEKKGVYSFNLTEKDLNEIKQMANDIGIFSMKDKYDSPITDIPSTIIIYFENGKRKKILDRHKGPEELKRFEKLIDVLINSKEWQAAE